MRPWREPASAGGGQSRGPREVLIDQLLAQGLTHKQVEERMKAKRAERAAKAAAKRAAAAPKTRQRGRPVRSPVAPQIRREDGHV